MKIQVFNIKKVGTILGFGAVLFVAACGNHAQQQAYELAIKSEQSFTVENAPAIVAEYQRVIALEPGSDWAGKARTRITAVETRLKAEELHKSVFQEHGVD